MKRWQRWTLGTMTAALALAGCRGPGAPRHVVLVTIDTLRADHSTPYGYPYDTTPTLAALAREGTLFERHRCLTPTTDPSHATMMTGVPARAHGCRRNGIPIDPSVPQLAEVLAKAGFETAAFTSRAHLSPQTGFRGFTTFSFPEYTRNPDEVNAELLPWLRARRADAPLFLWVHYWEPHAPNEPPECFIRRQVEAREAAGAASYGTERLARLLRWDVPCAAPALGLRGYTREQIEDKILLYDADAGWSDEGLARLLQTLRELGMLAETLLIVTADHGETLDELVASHNYGFDHGEFLYEHQVRVPMVVAGPGVPRGRRVGRPTDHTDIVPTVATALGVDWPSPLEGRPLLGDGPAERWEFLQLRTFSDEPVEAEDPRVAAHGPGFLDSSQYAVVRGEYKLIWSVDGSRELYDLAADPGERKDLSAEEPGLAGEMEDALFAWLARTRPAATAVEAAPAEW